MRTIAKKEGYAYLIDWIARVGDLILINVLYFLLISFLVDRGSLPHLGSQANLTLLLIINLVYFITSSFIRINVAENIVFLDKVIQNATWFIISYMVILTASIAVFGIFKIPLVSWIAAGVIVGGVFILWRVIFRLMLKKYRYRGKNFKKVIIIGGNVTGRDVFDQLVGSDYGYKILGFFDDNEDLKNVYSGYLGKLSGIEEFVEENNIDEIYCALLGDREMPVNSLMTLAEKKMIRFYLVPEYHKYVKRRMTLRFLDNIPLMMLRNEPLEYTGNRIMKRVFDIVFSSLVLLTIFPIMYVVCAILIKLSSLGPVFFKQKRTGIQGQEFDCYKFRSMKMNAKANEKSATKGDSRVTKIGRIMRASSIDEFPQFINVLKGDMSIVGPRPHMLKHTEEYSALIGKFMVRHLVKPGITGWAQVCGWRGETKTVGDMDERVKRDVWYIENWTPFLDIKIIFLTVINIFRGEENAY